MVPGRVAVQVHSDQGARDVRFNMDFFNVFNNPNNPTGVAGTGFLSTRNSGSAARIMQLALRLTW